MINDIKDRMAAIDFFAEELRISLKLIRGRAPTRKIILDNLDQWISTIETIKQISEANGVE